MPPSQNARKTYYTQFPKDLSNASYLVSNDSRLQWDALYNLKDKQATVVQLTLTNNSNLDFDLAPNSPLILILSQDTVGGWTPTFSKNSDNSLKFLGTTAITWVTTANTYTSLLFWNSAANKSFLISYLSGGNLV